MHLTAKGQVTIPKAFRDAIGVAPGDAVEFDLEDDAIFIRKPGAVKALRGKRLVEALRGLGSGTMTTDEIMRMTRGDDWNAPYPH